MFPFLGKCTLITQEKRDILFHMYSLEHFWQGEHIWMFLLGECCVGCLLVIPFATKLCQICKSLALSIKVENFRRKCIIWNIWNSSTHQLKTMFFFVLNDLYALILILIILKLVSNWIWPMGWAVCGAEWFGWAFIGWLLHKIWPSSKPPDTNKQHSLKPLQHSYMAHRFTPQRRYITCFIWKPNFWKSTHPKIMMFAKWWCLFCGLTLKGKAVHDILHQESWISEFCTTVAKKYSCMC